MRGSGELKYLKQVKEGILGKIIQEDNNLINKEKNMSHTTLNFMWQCNDYVHFKNYFICLIVLFVYLIAIDFIKCIIKSEKCTAGTTTM